MTKETEELEIVRGSGNVFRDAGFPNANVEQAKALLAAQIIKVLRTQNMTNRAASKISGVTEADIPRIKQPDLKRFTIDRLMTILNKLDPEKEIRVQCKDDPKRAAVQEERAI